MYVQGASRPSCVGHRSRTPEAHTRCVPHAPYPQSCYQFCSLSSCTNNDTSAAQVSSSILKRLLDTVSMNSGGWGAPHPAVQRSSALGDQSWCSWAVSQHTVDPIGCSGSWTGMSHSAALLIQALASGHSLYGPGHCKPCLSHNQGLAGYLSSIVPQVRDQTEANLCSSTPGLWS